MADVKIPSLTAASTLDGTELMEAVQGVASVKLTTQNVANINIQKATIPLSSAEILQLFTTPKTLIAAPGAGKLLNIINWVYVFTYNSIAYATNTNLIFGIAQQMI